MTPSYQQRVLSAFRLLDLPHDSGKLRLSPCVGGDINQTFRCETGDRVYFVKLHDTEAAMFRAESTALESLSSKGKLNTPTCYGSVEEVSGAGCLVLAYVPMQRLDDKGYFAAGKMLAQCHQSLGEYFGWPEHNFIGSTPQLNHRSDNWPDFFLEQRIGFQIDRLRDSNLRALRKRLPELNSLFDDHQPAASLLHGDLWGGNLSADSKGLPIFYDPASYYGDRETDLAMTELFGRFPPEFYHGYESIWPIDEGYQQRKSLYQLYHILNHANLFGGGYRAQAAHTLTELLNKQGR